MSEGVTQLFVGSYGERGLVPLTLGADGSLTAHEASDAAANASFGCFSPRQGLLYLVDERDEGGLGAFRWMDGGWKRQARVSSHGALPCYVSLSADEGALAVANYGDGATALIALEPCSGLPTEQAQVHKGEGRGPVEDRQDGPHAHCAVFGPDGGWLYQTDLGTDEIRVFPYDTARQALGESVTAWRAPPGSGPRHLMFHPDGEIAVLVCELASTLTVFGVGEGKLEERQTLSTLPPGYRGESLGGHIAFTCSGERLYVTNRGHDSVGAFALKDGRLHLLGHTPSGGASPRFFLLLENKGRLLVAHEEGDSVTAFAVSEDGALTPCGEAKVTKPAFIFAAPTPDK